jgi:3-hydroxyacyl-CoA dehydrogenase
MKAGITNLQGGGLGRKTGKGWYDYTSGERKPRKDVSF